MERCPNCRARWESGENCRRCGMDLAPLLACERAAESLMTRALAALTAGQVTDASHDCIRLRGVRQNNLKDLDLDLPLGELIVITGVSGSGKSSLAFDTVYAEGQRRYVETFSPYARQFLDRMDRPAADRIEGIPPAIAIDQTNPVRTSRSTVGTMTELADHLKLLFARGADLFCRGCGREVRRDTPESIWAQLAAPGDRPRVLIAFEVPVPESFGGERGQGTPRPAGLCALLVDDDEACSGHPGPAASDPGEPGPASGGPGDGPGAGPRPALRSTRRRGRRARDRPWRFSTDLHCPDCDIAYRDPVPNLFSFNSPVGACETCRGFGRTIGVDWDLVVPDPSKSLIEGAIKPIQSDSYSESPGGPDGLRPPPGPADRRPLAGPDRRPTAAGSSRARGSGRPGSGTASAASSTGWRGAPTRCTCGCSCPATAPTMSAPPAMGPD
jgi:hypothetical protein